MKITAKDINKASKYISSPLLRPPHGQIRPRQAKYLLNKYKIVMWTILAGDYNPDKTPEECFNNVRKNLKPGSIIVFHDSLKAKNNVLDVLPKLLENLKNMGYRCEKIKL